MEEMLEKKLADAISAGQWQEVKELAGKWAARYGPDPVAGISDEARLAQQAERRKDDVAAKRHWAEARRMAEQIPPKPDEWLIATFLQMAACLWLDELNERSRLADALQQVKGPEGEGLEKRFSEVVRWVEKVRDAFPDSANAWCLLGLARDWAGEFEQALSDYAKAIEIKPDYAAAYCNRGNVYARKGEIKRALSDYSKAIEIKPDFAAAYCNRGVAYADEGELERALSDFNKAIEIKPDFVAAYCNRGNAYIDKGEFERALADYNKAIEIKPDYAAAYYNRGFAYYSKGELLQALSDYAKAIEIKPDDAEVYLDKALACQEAMEKYPERREEFKRQAINALRKFIELAPKKGLRAYVSDARQMLRELGAE